MGIPYQCLTSLGKGTLFCAARGCSIQTFDLSMDPQLLFTWSHPSLKQAEKGSVSLSEQKPGHEQNAGKAGQPPSKRRKVGDSQDGPVPSPAAEGGAGGEKGQEKGKQKDKPKGQQQLQKPEPPFVNLLTATEDGSHVIAVTGQDKTLWVFENDGKGSLKEISRRAMPKRPCSLALTADGKTILSADKFGDVYALPLVPSPEDDENVAKPSSETRSASATPAPASQAAPKGANEFTVHSQRNRRALEDQLRQREANAKRDLPKEGPAFAHQVLLGHVSMLTSVLNARDNETGRPYIITADRDEHIRVSRGIPQTHVIETFCLGHASFVSALCVIPPLTKDEGNVAGNVKNILISGGGDDALYVWDWLAGKLLGTTDLLSHVRDFRPEVSKIAVAKLFTYELDGERHVVAICERIPALFIFQYQEDPHNPLTHLATLRLRGNPLDITTVGLSGQTLLVAIDPLPPVSEGNSGDFTSISTNSDSILILGPEGRTWGEAGTIAVTSTNEGNEEEENEDKLYSREDLDKALYTVENLRKTDFDHEHDQEPNNNDQHGQNEAEGQGGKKGIIEASEQQQQQQQLEEILDTKMEGVEEKE
ncbi:hypothetical protein F5Y17DRAFT_425283 [Xylariaceae sp. FL0594]|nr:hypothetical protein F5Y17DRAFT_425283 [Xylariaceae sp. FL0594]